MPASSLRRAKRLSIALVFVLGACVVLYLALNWWAHRTVRQRISEVAVRYGSEWVKPDAAVIVLDLWNRSAHVYGLEWTPLATRDSALLCIDGRIDSLILEGVGVRGLIAGEAFHIDALSIVLDRLNVSFPVPTEEADASTGGLSLLTCGSLGLRSGPVSIARSHHGTTRVMAAMVQGGSLSCTLQQDAPPIVAFEEFDALLTGIQRTPFADSVLFVDTIALRGVAGTVHLAGVRFGVQDVQHLAQRSRHERDVIAGSVERLDVTGFDLERAIQGVPICSTVSLGSASLKVARDKVLPDPAYQYKPLPARLIRELPLGAGADSLILEDLDVVYFERVDVDRGFARIPFDSIVGVMSGLRHSTRDTMMLQASARVMGRTPVALSLRAAVGDTTDRVEVEASVGRLAFAALNPVLGPLTGVGTPAGHLDTLILRMHGGDRHASARCWMRYDGLKLDRRANKNKALDPVLGTLLNAVVKRKRTGEREGDGWRSYSWQRRRDRALFNYLWSGVREGAKTSMLPQAVLKQVGSR